MLAIKTSTLIVAFLFIGCSEGSPTVTIKNLLEISKPQQSEILKAINQARSEIRDCHDGLGLVGPANALVWSDNLYASAYEHSSDLAESDTFSHLGSGTVSDVTGSNAGKRSLFYERIEANGYVGFYSLGENIAGGQEEIKSVMKDWLESPAHCANIMSDKFSEVGVAMVVNPDSNFKIYWTQNFGSKK